MIYKLRQVRQDQIRSVWMVDDYILEITMDRYDNDVHWSISFCVDESYDLLDIPSLTIRVRIVLSLLKEFKHILSLPSLKNAVLVADVFNPKHSLKFFRKIGFKKCPDTSSSESDYYFINK